MKANKAGRAAEDALASILASLGKTFSRQVVVGRSIYGTELRADFVVSNLPLFPNGLILESKWQDVDGSVDEKFPYLLENIRTCYPLPVMVIVHGGGCRPGALRWLCDRIDGDRLIAVLSLEGFLSWALRTDKVSV